MNIDDVAKDSIVIPQGSLFDAMFKHQHGLAIRYEPIERRNGFWHPGTTLPHIDDAKLQHFLKDMFWRTTEELAEAYECLDSIDSEWRSAWDEHADVRHFFEELADSLHFLIEATVYSQISFASIDPLWVDAQRTQATVRGHSLVPSHMQSIIMRMGLAANCLKNKPWKETQMPTDVGLFRKKLIEAWEPMCQMWSDLGCTLDEVYVLYMRKNAVNLFRQRTKY